MSLADELESVIERATEKALEKYLAQIPAALEKALAERDNDRLITVEELANIMGRTPCALRTILTRKTGAALRDVALKIGGSLRWRRSEALAVIETLNVRGRK